MTYDPVLTTPAPTGAPAVRRISWGAVLAGVVLTLAVHLLLTLLGMAIGMAAVDPADPGGFGIGAAIWWAISSLIAVFIGGWVGARLAGVPNLLDGMLHGLLVWSAATLLSVYLLTSALGSLAGGVMNVLGGAANVAGQVAPQAAPLARSVIGPMGGSDGASVEEVLRELEDSLTGPNAATARQELRQIFTQARDQDVTTPQFRQRVVDFLTQRGDLQRARAEQLADQSIQAYQQARQRLAELGDQAIEVADDATDGIARAAIWGFLALLFGAVAGAVGGRKGTPAGTIGHDRGTMTPARH